MRVPANAKTESLDFDELGRTLELLDGETCTLAVAFMRASGAAPFGGVRDARLQVKGVGEEVVEEDPVTVKSGERVHLVDVGGFAFAVGSAEFVGAGYENRVLGMQTGSVLVKLDFNGGDTNGA